MTDPRPAIDAEALLAEEVLVRRLARALLFDEHRAEDVVQQTWITALRDAPVGADRRTIRSWLSTVVRRKAKRAVWSAGRRAHHERSAARAERVLPSADELIAREELRGMVVAELDALPEPYRTAVALRHLDGTEPVEIARLQGVPAATVRARVRRGLAMLRERLDARHGGDRGAWSLALVPLAAPAKGSGMAITSYVLVAGVLVKLLSAAVALVAVALTLFVAWPRAPLAGGSEPEQAVAATAAESSPVARDSLRPAPTTRRSVDVATTSPASSPNVATLRGRCVDERGAPVAGAVVTLRGGAADLVAVSYHELRHGPLDWAAPEPFTTGADGRFDIRFDVPPAFAFHGTIEHETRIGRHWSLRDVAPGSVREVGDVVLPPGCRLRGRVLDRTGSPVTHQALRISPPTSSNGVVFTRTDGFAAPSTSDSLAIEADGRFVSRPLPPGDYALSVSGHEVEEPSHPIRLSAPLHDVVIRVRDDVPADVPTITGIVLDPSGRPVPGAQVSADGLEPFDLRSRSRYADRDGRFTLARSPGSDPTVATLRAFREGFALGATSEPIAWGSRDVPIHLGPPAALTVRVTDGSEPVERYGIQLEPIRDRPGQSAADAALRAIGDHAGGVVTLNGLTPARYRLAVVPADDTRWFPSAAQEIDLRDGRPADVRVRVPARTGREIRVVDRDGGAVVGATVELAATTGDREFTLATAVLDHDAARMAMGDVAIGFDDGTTDLRGAVRLRGPDDRDLHLRLPGPGHAPRVFGPLRLDDPESLQVVVDRGGAVTGRVGPRDVLDQLRAVSQAAGGDLGLVLAGLYERSGQIVPPPSDAAPIAADGCFTITGVPSGRWRLELACHERFGSGTTRTRRPILARIEVRDAATTEVDIDVSDQRRFDVAVDIRIDGQPHAAQVYAEGRVGRGPDGLPGARTAIAETDSQGRCTLSLQAGSWTVEALVDIGGATRHLEARTVQVGPGGAAVLDLHARSARRAIRVLRPNGEPAAGVVVEARAPSPDIPRGRATGHVVRIPSWVTWSACAPTDALGRSELRWVAGRLHLSVTRLPFVAAGSVSEWMRAHPDLEPAQRVVDLGTVELPADGGPELVLRLPADWERLPD